MADVIRDTLLCGGHFPAGQRFSQMSRIARRASTRFLGRT